eukprot:TRINITY_DN2109_c0_g4_i5.p1 TRINITY_DN2109_c0_g4~~TRINITY_DN2109_c0_g4_i5.p1  ORF type:complete len:339 (-),score=28.05 TRINITY_DN2109_c0_g4_i5:103-1119(-)
MCIRDRVSTQSYMGTSNINQPNFTLRDMVDYSKCKLPSPTNYSWEKLKECIYQEQNLVNDYPSLFQNCDEDPLPPHIRAKLVSWMIESVGSINPSNATIEISILYLDLLLRKKQIHISELQLFAALCIKLAFRIYESFDYTVEHVFIACHQQYPRDLIKKKELEILYLLEWKLIYPATSQISHHMLHLFAEEKDLIQDTIEEQTSLFIELCFSDIILSFFKPSIKAVASLLCAYEKLKLFEGRDKLVQAMTSALDLDKEAIDNCRKQIYEVINLESPEYIVEINAENIIRIASEGLLLGQIEEISLSTDCSLMTSQLSSQEPCQNSFQFEEDYLSEDN